MKRNLVGVLIALIFVVTSCTSNKKIEPDDEFAVEANTGSQTSSDSLDKDLSLDGPAEPAKAPPTDTAKSTPADSNQDLALENELSSLDNNTAKPAPGPETAGLGDELSLDEPAAAPVAAAPPVIEPVTPPPVEPAPLIVDEPAVPQPVTDTPVVDLPAASPPSTETPAVIDNVAYKANQNGGTVQITSNRPLKYTTRLNKDTNQLLVEVENSILPKKLKRSLNTKDMASSIGSVDMYQKSGSNISRFVVQLRPGAFEPLVQPEGNAILIVGGAPAPAAGNNASPQDLQNSSVDGRPMSANNEIADLSGDGIMSSDDLEDFLISNNKFYGKKIYIQTGGMDLKDALRFLAEEGGVNIIMDEGVGGTVSLNLRNVPWDQAFILILKSKKLAFKRQGNVLRVAKIDDIKKDEDEAIQRLESRKSKVPLVVKRFYIGYADLGELEGKISKFLTSTQATSITGNNVNGQPAAAPQREIIGKVISDKRTSSLIVTDTEDNMAKIEKLIKALDTQPMQVLIEGKVVEAKEEFTRGLGIFWSSTPPTGATSSARIGITPALDAGFNVLDSTLSWGSLDILGSLTAQLQLGERTDKVKVLSSPRISVLSGEPAKISQTAGILIPTVTTAGTGTSGATTTFTTAQVGVNLNVTPQVSNEGTVRMTLDITRSFLARVDSQVQDVRNATTTVIVKSGQTAVIGGIFESEVRAGESGIPGLQDVPIIGRLFKGDRDAKSKNELVIFITPNILKPVLGTEKRGDSDLQ